MIEVGPSRRKHRLVIDVVTTQLGVGSDVDDFDAGDGEHPLLGPDFARFDNSQHAVVTTSDQGSAGGAVDDDVLPSGRDRHTLHILPSSAAGSASTRTGNAIG